MIAEQNGDVWLTPQEAAARLGLSVGRIYHIKDKLTHRKGNSPRSRVFFLESRLFEDYTSI